MDPYNVNDLFEKLYEFDLNSFTKLKSLNNFLRSSLWNFEESKELIDDLNAVRCRLNDKNLSTWEEHTSKTDLSSFILSEVRRKVPSTSEELTTRAWLKLTEIFFSFQLVDLDKINQSRAKEVDCLFLCEAPGGFINSANHHIKSFHPNVELNWTATTLNPYYEEIDAIKLAITDDRFIRQKKIFDHWFFGNDDKGDLLDLNFIKQLIDKFKEQKVDLITGDGGINCIDNPAEQENLSFSLLFNQFLVAINCLKPKSCCVIKFFTLFSSQTLCLVYLIANLFERLIVFKPATSKAGNSEVYIICLKLIDGYQEMIKQLTQEYFIACEKYDNVFTQQCLLGEEDIPIEFREQFIECSKLFKDYQKSAIIRNLNIFDNPKRENIYQSLIAVKKIFNRIYLRKYNIQPIHSQLQLCDGCDLSFQKFDLIKLNRTKLFNLVCSQESFQQRKLDARFKYDEIPEILNTLYDKFEADSVLSKWWTLKRANVSTINFLKGKPLTKITNSKFIDVHLLHLFNLLTNDRRKRIYVGDFQANLILNSWERFRKILKTTISSNQEKFASIIGPKSSIIIDSIFYALQSLESCASISIILNDVVEEKMAEISSTRNIVVIDPLQSQLIKLVQGHLNKDATLSIIFQENETVKGVVHDLIKVIHLLKPKDVVIIHLDTCLSRLSVGLVYLLTSLYSDLSIVPAFTHSLQHTVNETALQLGMLFIFTNNDLADQSACFDKILIEKIVSTLKQMESNFEQNCFGDSMQSESLLEIFRCVDILSNDLFCQLIYTGNFVHLTEKLKTIVQ